MKEEPIIVQDTRGNNGSSGYLGTCQSVSGVYSLQDARVPQGERKTNVRELCLKQDQKEIAWCLETTVSPLLQSQGHSSRCERTPQTFGSLLVYSVAQGYDF